jgi:hypothetical protein
LWLDTGKASLAALLLQKAAPHHRGVQAHLSNDMEARRTIALQRSKSVTTRIGSCWTL